MKKNKILPISCLCSIYEKTLLDEFILSIDSLLIQDYLPKEIVIVVDGNINEELHSYLNHLVNLKDIFKIYFFKKNRGLGRALKYGLNKCNNDLIARFDSDDINLNNRLKIQYDLLKENQNISIVGSNIFEFSDNYRDVFIKKMERNLEKKK